MNAQFKEIAKEAFIIAYKENFGNITISCEASGVGRTQYKTWLKDDPEFAKRLAEIEPEEIMLDFGEQRPRVRRANHLCRSSDGAIHKRVQQHLQPLQVDSPSDRVNGHKLLHTFASWNDASNGKHFVHEPIQPVFSRKHCQEHAWRPIRSNRVGVFWC